VTALDARARVADRLHAEGWTSTRTLQLLDASVRVTSDDAALVGLVDELYSHTSEDAGSADVQLLVGAALGPDGPGWFVARDGMVLVRTPGPTVAFTHLVFEANQQAILRTSGQVRLHASAVASGSSAIVCAGVMQAGKSTLAAGLMRRGLDYVTDEVVAFTPEGRVRPYAKPLSLGVPPPALGPVGWSPPAGGARFLGASGLVPPDSLGRVTPERDLRLELLVLPRYRRGAPTVVRELRGSAAVDAVAAHAFHLDEPTLLARLVALITEVPCIEVESGDLAEACDAVLAARSGPAS
jgi:hypothetical protein